MKYRKRAIAMLLVAALTSVSVTGVFAEESENTEPQELPIILSLESSSEPTEGPVDEGRNLTDGPIDGDEELTDGLSDGDPMDDEGASNDEDLSDDEEPSNDEDLSDDGELSNDEEPSNDEDPSDDEKPSDDEEPSDDGELSDDEESSDNPADEGPEGPGQTSTLNETENGTATASPALFAAFRAMPNTLDDAGAFSITGGARQGRIMPTLTAC